MADQKPKDFIIGPDGKKVYIKDLPLIAFQLYCGHMGRDYGVAKGDTLFCETCRTPKRVKRIIAG